MTTTTGCSLDDVSTCFGKGYHVFEAAGERLLMSVRDSSLVAIKSDDLFDLLSEYERLGPDDATTMNELMDRRDWPESRKARVAQSLQKLLPFSLAEDKPFAEQAEDFMARLHHNLPHGTLHGLTLMVSEACNLRCKYCYTGLQVDKWPQRLMGFEVAKAAVDLVFSQLTRDQGVHIQFMGGEPLLNLPVVKQTIEYTRHRGQKIGRQTGFDLTTNAVRLDEDTARWLVANRCGILVSLDGPSEHHDAMRPRPNGKGSHAQILRNIQFLRRLTGQLCVRCTLTPSSPPLAELAKYFESIGVTELLLSTSMQTEDNYSPDICYDAGSLKKAQDQSFDMIPLGYAMIKQGRYHIIAGVSRDHLSRFNCQQPHSFHMRCGHGRSCSAVGADGKIYPCHRYWPIDGFAIGDVFKGFDLERSLAFIGGITKNVVEQCSTCWARYRCLGGCSRYRSTGTGDFRQIDEWNCTYYRRHLEVMAAYFAKFTREAPERLAQYCGSGAGTESVTSQGYSPPRHRTCS